MSKPKPQVIEDEEHQRVFERVAAIDVAKASGMVCVRLPGRDGQPRASKVWEVQAVTSAISDLGRRLLSNRVQMVTLEATSDYWRIFYYLLEALGLAVQLVSPAQARQLKGRPKTDKHDAVWLARLTEWGMLRPCFVPPADPGTARLHPRPHQLRPRADPLLPAAGEAARRRADQAVVGGQQADHRIGQGHGARDDRRGTRPARAGQPGPHKDESQARCARRGADRHVRRPPRRASPRWN